MEDSRVFSRTSAKLRLYIAAFVAAFCWLCVPGSTGAASGPPPIALSPDQARQILGPHLSVFVDPKGSLGMEQVASPPFATRFRPNNHSMLKLGTVDGAAWLRFDYRLPVGARPCNWVLELSKPLMDRIDFYFPRQRGGWRRVAAGNLAPPAPEMQLSRTPALALPEDLPPSGTIYIRLQHRFGLGMNLVFHTRLDYDHHLLMDSYLYGLFYGVPLALALFNLFVYLSLKDRVYLWYMGFMISMFVYQLFVHGQVELLGMRDQELNLRLFGIPVALALVFGAQFSRSFLLTRKNAPLMDKLFTAVMIAAVLRGLLSIFGYHRLGNQFAQLLGLISPILALGTGTIVVRRGFTPARYYLLAWSAFSAGIVWHVLVSLGVFPWGGLSSMMMVVGAAAEAILLSFALADRIRVLRRERETLAEATRHYRELSNSDALTGLFNARFFRENFSRLMADCRESKRPLSLLMLDIDDFKQYNDLYGHPEGDKVLAAIGRVISECVRQDDLPCRYGGEEFAVILPGADRNQAGQVAERIRKQFAAFVFRPLGPGEAASVTASLGLAQMAEGESATELLARADQALYQAKSQGKNQTVIAP